MSARDELSQLPLSVQIFLKCFAVGAAVGVLMATVFFVRFLRTPAEYQAEMLFEAGLLYVIVVGFPLSLVAYPLFFLAPWAGMILLPAVNAGALGLLAVGVYRVFGRLPFLRNR